MWKEVKMWSYLTIKLELYLCIGFVASRGFCVWFLGFFLLLGKDFFFLWVFFNIFCKERNIVEQTEN